MYAIFGTPGRVQSSPQRINLPERIFSTAGVAKKVAMMQKWRHLIPKSLPGTVAFLFLDIWRRDAVAEGVAEDKIDMCFTSPKLYFPLFRGAVSLLQ